MRKLTLANLIHAEEKKIHDQYVNLAIQPPHFSRAEYSEGNGRDGRETRERPKIAYSDHTPKLAAGIVHQLVKELPEPKNSLAGWQVAFHDSLAIHSDCVDAGVCLAWDYDHEAMVSGHEEGYPRADVHGTKVWLDVQVN